MYHYHLLCASVLLCRKVSTRGALACGGILSALLGIVAAIGFLAIVGYEYVSFVGMMPFLILGKL